MAPPAIGLDPSKLLSQYVYEKWQADRGFVGGEVNTICQSGDGYLWIGTERGLVRFDGVHFKLIRQPIADEPSIGSVRGLIADPNGDLWIRVDGRRLLRYHDGQFIDAIARYNLTRMVYTAMAEGRDGTLYFVGLGNRAYSYQDGVFRTIKGATKVPGTVITIAQTRDHTLWLGTRNDGLWRREGAHFILASTSPVERNIDVLLPANNGGLWIGTDHGLVLWNGQKLMPILTSPALTKSQILSMSIDPDDNLWLGTDHGLVRYSRSGRISIDPPFNPHQPMVSSTYIDRQGELWFGSPDGISRLKDGKFEAFGKQQGLPTDGNGAIYVDRAGRVWVAPLSGGLYWFKGGKVHAVTRDGLGKDVIYSIGGAEGEVWLGTQRDGLTELAVNNEPVVAKTYRQRDGLAQNSIFSVFMDRSGEVWAGTVSAGVSRLKDGKIVTYTSSDGLSSNTINSIAETPDGRIWLGTADGLDSYWMGEWVNYSTFNGLPSAYIRTIYADREGVLWVATASGLAYFAKDKLHVPDHLPEPLREPICGMAEDANGKLWITTSDHVIEVSRNKMLEGSVADSDEQTFGVADGLPSAEGVAREHSVVADKAHRIWMSLSRGIAMTDLRLTEMDTLPLSVRMEEITAGQKQLAPNSEQNIESESHQIAFTFGANTLEGLNRIRFRYKLEGYDSGWNSGSKTHQVTYTNLSPGDYRFDVIASNAEGLWNGPQTSIPFSILPAYWQTWWFRGVVLFACLVLLALLHRLRTYQLVRGLNMRFQERLAERTRIAQELHDTLLQGVLSASMQLDLAEDQLPEGSPVKPSLQRVMELMRQVTEEGRSALRGLRTAGDGSSSLEQSFSRIPMELCANDRISFRVTSTSSHRPVSPPIRDEAYRIGREALTNAFRHAQAHNIEVEVDYGRSHLRILIRDDGRGIDPRILADGRDGHWGLIGMQERSERIGGRLRLRSRIDAGTEVELTIPASVAYSGQTQEGAAQWRRWLSRGDREGIRSSGKCG